MATCYNCGRSMGPGEATQTRVLKGHNGRQKSGYVLMCPSCSSSTVDHNKTVAIMVLIAMAFILLLFWALGIPLGKHK